MKLWCTEIKALDPRTGEMKTWCGDDIPALSASLAQQWLDNNYKGYMKVIGELVTEIPCKEDTYEPDWDKMIDYENIQNN